MITIVTSVIHCIVIMYSVVIFICIDFMNV